MKVYRLICFLYCFALVADAGVDDYLIYDDENRYSLEKLDAVVEVQVNDYYAFADNKIWYNFAKEKNRYLNDWKPGTSRSSETIVEGDEFVWESLPDRNALSLLNAYSLWVADCTVTNILLGECEEKNVYIVMKQAPAFVGGEMPHFLVRSETNFVRRVFGLVRISEEEFRRDFRRKRCYLHNSQDILWDNKAINPLFSLGVLSSICPSRENTAYYVMREIGVEEEPRFGLEMLKSTFIQKVENEIREKKMGL